jgi:hypothetical protein
MCGYCGLMRLIIYACVFTYVYVYAYAYKCMRMCMFLGVRERLLDSSLIVKACVGYASGS